MRGQKKEIYDLIKDAKTISLQEIRSKTTINYNTIRSAVIGLTNQGLIERAGRGL